MNSDFSDFARFFPIFRLFPTFRLLDSTGLFSTPPYGGIPFEQHLCYVGASLIGVVEVVEIVEVGEMESYGEYE